MSDLGSDDSWVAEGDSVDENGNTLKSDRSNRFCEEPELRERRYSFPLSPTRLKELPNTLVFEKQIEDIKQANTDFLIDNCYTETKPVLDPFSKRKVKTISRRTQTYLRELL